MPPSASPRVVRALYQSLLLSARQLQSDLEAGHTLFNAIRSGATDTYAGVKSDWQRERKFDARFTDMQAIQKWHRKRAFVTLVRSQFAAPLGDDRDPQRAVSQRIDAAFAALRDVDDHNAMIRDLTARGAFQPKRRTDAVKFVVGDIVHVNDVGRGVVTGWTVARSHAFADLHVTYDILPHAKPGRDAGRLHRVPQEDLEPIEAPEPVRNASLLLFFDGFERGRHVPSAPLACRFPDDVMDNSSATFAALRAGESVPAPSIVQLQFADEATLLQYLRCDDATVVQFATAALEGKWLGASSEHAQRAVREALQIMDAGDFARARELLQRVVEDEDPEYAYAWAKLGMAAFRAGDADAALRYYAIALEKNPQLLDALTGLGTCATKLQHWEVAHRAAVALMRLQPRSEVARILLENAIVSSL